jgi:protein TonB
MQTKKNPKKDTRRWAMIFFQIGLIIVLFLSWQAIEYTSVEKEEINQQTVQFDQLNDEEVPITQPPPPNQPPPPPPPPPAPEKIEVVEDEVEVEEKVIETPEVIEEPQVVEVSEVQEAPAEAPIEDVPFSVIQDKPIFPGCEKFKTSEKRADCMNDKVQEFISRRFDTNLASELGLTGTNRIDTQFIIDKNGNIVDIKVRAPHPRLEEEVKRVIGMLPKMKPGQQRGKPVGVRYGVPIRFNIRD